MFFFRRRRGRRVAIDNEANRLRTDTPIGDPPYGFCIDRIQVECAAAPADVLSRTREVLGSVVENSTDPWPDLEYWRSRLPLWFVEACAPQQTPEENEAWNAAWRKATPEQRAVMSESAWTLESWIGWFEPDERFWFWWDGRPTDADRAVVEIITFEAFYAWGALKWLLKASGARSAEMVGVS